ncbi:LysR family transcriptional regulator [Alteromonas sp. ALT199]|uniref:LysR family transcriptional regulator n=1 Tax=unclassified Alteromonas TaxID=2614992 RepID=UPI001BEC2CEE|nr:LysR family transcriptional regulator [Alteromonas sp. ALT199]MBT3133760.1 LysR family transcriptional regulator [Alteromonas sp. ALT199]
MKTEDLSVFVKVAEVNSITAAAKQLDISSSAASMAIKRLEEQLGVALFVRSTRKIRLSHEGEQYLPMAQQALDMLQQGLSLITEERQSVNGELRMAMSSEMGRNLMRELLNKVQSENPELSLRLHVSDSRVDFYRDGVDVALRAMTKEAVKESQMYGFKVCNIPHVICASPKYLEKYSEPLTANNLIQHNALLYKLYDQTHNAWELVKESEKIKVKVRSNRAVNDGDIVRRWCVDGMGIAKKSAIDVAEDLLSGKLKRVLNEYQVPLTEMWLMLPSRHLITPAVRLVRDELKLAIEDRRHKLIEKGLLNESEWPWT